MTIGVCKLTLKPGKYVKSHLIPLAFSAPSKGCYFIDGAPGGRPTRRPTSWYDREIVTRAGEDILADLDSFAAKELRRLRLVWSGWKDEVEFSENLLAYPDSPFLVRLIFGAEVLGLRVFFLSLLWRAAVSNQNQNAHIILADQQLEQLRQMVLNKNPYPLSFMPVHLTQLTTKGGRHNLGPLHMEMPLYQDEPSSQLTAQSYRFYFDGLIANIMIDLSPENYDGASAIYLGGDEKILALCVKFEDSFQAQNMDQHKLDAFTNHPSTMLKLFR